MNTNHTIEGAMILLHSEAKRLGLSQWPAGEKKQSRRTKAILRGQSELCAAYDKHLRQEIQNSRHEKN